MSDTKKQYVTAVGFVQFDPADREANGKSVRDIVIKTPGGDGKNIRITVWPEIQGAEVIEKGDFIAVDGGFSSSTYQAQDGTTKTSLQISAYNLAVLGKTLARADREVVQGGGDAAAKSNVPF